MQGAQALLPLLWAKVSRPAGCDRKWTNAQKPNEFETFAEAYAAVVAWANFTTVVAGWTGIPYRIDQPDVKKWIMLFIQNFALLINRGYRPLRALVAPFSRDL